MKKRIKLIWILCATLLFAATFSACARFDEDFVYFTITCENCTEDITVQGEYNGKTALPVVTKDGYTFGGWEITDSSFSSQDQSKIVYEGGRYFYVSVKSAKDVAVGALWVPIEYTVYLDVNPDETVSKDTCKVPYEQSYHFPIPEKEDYIFVGWINKDTKEKVTDSDGVVSRWEQKEEVSLIAEWTHVCRYGEWITTEEVSCTSDGARYRLCEICNKREDNTLTAFGHMYEGDWVVEKETSCAEEGSQYKICVTCGHKEEQTIPLLAHRFTETVLTEASCTKKGSVEKKCLDCEYVETYETPKKDHRFFETVKKEADCTNKGSVEKRCLDCEYAETYATDALGHSYKSWVIDEEATCEKKGKKSCTCVRCETVKTVDIDMLPHRYDEGVCLEAATCEKNGLLQKKCLDCTAVKNEEIDALGHDFSQEWTIDTQVTCLTDGIKSHHCSRCTAISEVTTVPTPGHQYVDNTVAPKCEAQGYTEHTCSVCFHSYRDDFVAATGHKQEKKGTVVKTATCYENGIKEYKCENCSKLLKSEVTDLAKHDLTSWTVTEQPDCTTVGKRERHCKNENCTYKEVDNVAALGHILTDYIVTCEPTCTENGTEQAQCTRCQEVFSREISHMGHQQYFNDVCVDCGDNSGLYYREDNGVLYVYGIGNEKSSTIVIPEKFNGKNVVGIDCYAFKNCNQIMSVCIFADIEVIPSYAFDGCIALESIILPESLTEIQTDAFKHCDVSYVFSMATDVGSVTVAPNENIPPKNDWILGESE